MSQDQEYQTRINELRLEAFRGLSNFADDFVAKHYGDKENLVQFAIMLELMEYLCAITVQKNIGFEHLITIFSDIYNKFIGKEGKNPL